MGRQNQLAKAGIISGFFWLYAPKGQGPFLICGL